MVCKSFCKRGSLLSGTCITMSFDTSLSPFSRWYIGEVDVFTYREQMEFVIRWTPQRYK